MGLFTWKIVVIALLIGFITGGVFGYLMAKGALLKTDNFQPLSSKKTNMSFGQRLYDKKK